MAFQDWAPIVGGISVIVSFLLVLFFGLFPSTRGAGYRRLALALHPRPPVAREPPTLRQNP